MGLGPVQPKAAEHDCRKPGEGAGQRACRIPDVTKVELQVDMYVKGTQD